MRRVQGLSATPAIEIGPVAIVTRHHKPAFETLSSDAFGY